MYRLIFQKGPQQGRRVAIRQGPVILGRHPDATLRLPESEIALQHALLEDQPGGGTRLRRLAAGAVIRVNQQDVESADLHEGDIIEIGQHVLRFSGGAAAEATPEPIGRRLGLLQLLTLTAVGLLLIGQVIFLFVVSLSPQQATMLAVTETNRVVVAAPVSTPQVAVATNLALAPVVTQLPPRVVSVSTATPDRIAAVAPPPENSALSNELKKMQAELTQLHNEISALPPPKPAVITNVVTAPVVPSPPAVTTNVPAPELSADDLVLAQARKMFKKAMDRVTTLDAEELDGELATIQNMAPDFLPPCIERAQRLQQRGLLAEALEQWKRVQHLATTNAELKVRTSEEIASLQKRIAEPPKPKPKPETREQRPLASETKIPDEVATPRVKHVRAAQPVACLAQVESQKLLGGEKFDEMRLLRITVVPIGTAKLDSAALELFVTFFDRGEKTGTVGPSRAVVPGAALRAAAQAAPDAPLEFTASYLVPRGFRQQELQQTGERRRYFGYRVELVSHGELQDRRDQPPKLLPVE